MNQELNNALDIKYNLMILFEYFHRKNNLSIDKTYIKCGEPRFCFYNALTYASDKDIDLAWGLLITENSSSLNINLHGFCYDKKIIDVTYEGAGLYAYEIINRQIWHSWNNDLNLYKEYVLNRIYKINM